MSVFPFKPRYEQERIDPDRCRAAVWNGWRNLQCKRRATTEPDNDGLRWCGPHSPAGQERAKERSLAHWDRFRRQQDAAVRERQREANALLLMPNVLAYLRALHSVNPHDPELDRLITAITPLVESTP